MRFDRMFTDIAKLVWRKQIENDISQRFAAAIRMCFDFCTGIHVKRFWLNRVDRSRKYDGERMVMYYQISETISQCIWKCANCLTNSLLGCVVWALGSGQSALGKSYDDDDIIHGDCVGARWCCVSHHLNASSEISSATMQPG